MLWKGAEASYQYGVHAHDIAILVNQINMNNHIMARKPIGSVFVSFRVVG